MKTEILKIDINNIDAEKIKYSAEVIKSGGLVAFPTETVYGLGANGLDEKAVKKIFEAKGRPSDNPLILHIADRKQVFELAKDVPSNAGKLMDSFWPGPLTMIFNKAQNVPGVISAGLDTVALRMPSHPIALALIKESGVPIAAPSANTSGRPSPTNAKHVIEDLSGKIDVIIDAGNAKIGLESTVLDVTVDPPVVLRPGGITLKQIGDVIGHADIDPTLMTKAEGDFRPRSPGMKYKHYSPKADVIIVEGSPDRVLQKIKELVCMHSQKGKTVGVLATDQTKELYPSVEVISLGDRDKLETVAANLFWALREFDKKNVDIIVAEAVDYEGIGLAVMNRMKKAAAYNIIKA